MDSDQSESGIIVFKEWQIEQGSVVMNRVK